jgi:hypothetical protein
MQPLQMPPSFATGSANNLVSNNDMNQQMISNQSSNPYIRGPMPPPNNFAAQQIGSSTASAFSQPSGYSAPGSNLNNFNNMIPNNLAPSQALQSGSLQHPIITNQSNQTQLVANNPPYRPSLIQSSQLTGSQPQQPSIRPSYQPNGVLNQLNPNLAPPPNLAQQVQQMSNLSINGPNPSPQQIHQTHNQPQIQNQQLNKPNVMMPGPPMPGPHLAGPALGAPPMLSLNSGVPMMPPPPTSSMIMNRATTPNSAAGQYATQPLPYNMQQQQQQQLQQSQLQQQQISSYDQTQHHNSSANRMDMDQMPNPIEVMQANNSKYGGDIFETNESGKLPPLASTDFISKDSGNCNPRFIRSSIYSIPANPDILKQSKLPFVLSLTPFAELREGEVNQ